MYGMGELFEAEMRRFQENMSRMAGDLSRMPVMHLEDKNDNVVVKVELPGVSKENIQLTITEDRLEIKAVKETKQEKKNGCCDSYFAFHGVMSLPTVVPDKVKTTYKDGVLEVVIPKVKKKVVKEIKIE